MAAQPEDGSRLDVPQFELDSPPTDGITCVKFFHSSNHIAVSSWDKTVSIYDIIMDGNNSHSKKLDSYSHHAGVLDLSINNDDTIIYSAGADFALQSYSINNSNNNNKIDIIGYHSHPIRSVEYISNLNCILTGSWDKTLKLWDPRLGNANNNINNNNGLISTYSLDDKLFAMSSQSYYNGNNIVIGMADRQVWIYDIRNMNKILQKRESSLKHQTRYIMCHPNNEQYVLSSIEGRVAVEYFNSNKEYQSKKYAFKCHRHTEKSSENNNLLNNNPKGFQTIYPVNTISFHPIWYTFATGGGDGVVNIWDGENKKRICQFPSYKTSISDVDFNYNGNLLAIAQSYTWEQGELNDLTKKEKDTVFFKCVKENEAKPKQKAKKKKSSK